MTLTATIKTIQDIMRKARAVDSDAQGIGQLRRMPFLALCDQLEAELGVADALSQRLLAAAICQATSIPSTEWGAPLAAPLPSNHNPMPCNPRLVNRRQ